MEKSPGTCDQGNGHRTLGTMLTTRLVPAEDRRSRRLLIVLHGLGDSMAGWQWLPGALGLPDWNYLFVNAPDAYYGGFSWYDLQGDSGPGILRSRQLLFDLLDAQPQAGFPASETALLGFSQGCLMTVDVGFRYPHRLAALVGISGYVWDPEALIRERSPVAGEQRMLFTHGTRDPLIPCSDVHRQVQQLQQSGLSIVWHEFDKVHTLEGASEIRLIRDFLTRRVLL